MNFFFLIFILIIITIENLFFLECLLKYYSYNYSSYFNQINKCWKDFIYFFSINPDLVIIIFKILIILVIVLAFK